MTDEIPRRDVSALSDGLGLPPKRDVVGLLRNLERHGEDNIWRTAQQAREEVELLRKRAGELLHRAQRTIEADDARSLSQNHIETLRAACRFMAEVLKPNDGGNPQ
ncbi:MAG: hypothetical protein ABMA00_08955 [Gemmatimonas sp.]